MAAMAMAMAMVMGGVAVVKEGGGRMCHCPQRQLGEGGVMAAAVPANSRVPFSGVHAHKDDNNAMIMTTMMTTGSTSLTPHGRGWVGCKTG